MEKIPYLNDDFAKASEHLRLAVSLLSKHKIPPSPMNFRLGYDYAAGKSAQLKAVLDETVAQSNEFSGEDLWEVYRRFFVQDDKELEKIRNELRHVIVNIQSEFDRSGGDISNYKNTLNRFAEVLKSSTPSESMSAELQNVLNDTRSMEQSHQEHESNISSIMAEVASLRKELEQVKEESLTDALTGISNRKAFDLALEQTVQAAFQEKAQFSVLIADIDHFKKFNDTYGHLVGDKVLRFVASTIKNCLKGRDIVARFGGEEFCVILPQTALAGAESVAEQIRQAISVGKLKDRSSGQSYGTITISIGVAQCRWNEPVNELIQRADEALYLAKNQGRNRVKKAI